MLQGEFVILSSLKNDRSLLFSFFHSSATVTPFRARFAQDGMDSHYFFGYCLVKNSSFSPLIVFNFHSHTVAIFKYVSGGGSFLDFLGHQ